MPVAATSSSAGVTVSGTHPPPPAPPSSIELPAGALSSAEAIALFGSIAVADTQTDQARQKIDDAHQKRQKAIENAQRAIEAARRASEKGGFWAEVGAIAGNVGKYAAVAACVGGACASGGSSLVVAAALIGIGTSLAGDQMKRAGFDTEVCTIGGMDIKASDLVILGGAVAAIAVGAHAEPGTGTHPWLTDAGRHVVTASCGVQGGAAGVRAVSAERVGHYDAEVVDCAADQRVGENVAAAQQRVLLAAVDTIRTSREVRSKALEAVGSMLETRRGLEVALAGRRA
jgi:hypothetical protein